MTLQAKRTRAVYMTLTLLAVFLPMTGWFARMCVEEAPEFVAMARSSYARCTPVITEVTGLQRTTARTDYVRR